MSVIILFLLIVLLAVVGVILFFVGLNLKGLGVFFLGLLCCVASFGLFLWLSEANACAPYPPIEVGTYPVQTINDVNTIIFTDLVTTPKIVNLNITLGRTFKDGDKIHVTRLSQKWYKGVSYNYGRGGPSYQYEIVEPAVAVGTKNEENN